MKNASIAVVRLNSRGGVVRPLKELRTFDLINTEMEMNNFKALLAKFVIQSPFECRCVSECCSNSLYMVTVAEGCQQVHYLRI